MFTGDFFLTFMTVFTFEPSRDKTNKMACAPSEDSDQPGHPHEESLGPQLPTERTAKTDHTGRMPRLI